MHNNRLIFCSLNLNYSRKNYNIGVIILNLFPFITMKETPISSLLIQIQCSFQKQICMQMQKFSFHFPIPSSNLGNSLSTTSTKLVLDMTRTCPFIFHTIPNQSNFKVLDFFRMVHLHFLLMTIHLQLFQILPLCHNNIL